ncbi:MAG: Rpn family recombination-promoting nuclease/putative transposase, partial [Tannerella sp.]|nr:Rpn family recombination-promoting nuclease/putative transposase [Tannerella sp.]
LGIINEDFDGETSEFYHHYQITNRQNTHEVIKGMELVLVELPKFQPKKWSDRKMAVLWLRFLKEVEDRTKTVSKDLLSNKDIRKALDICEESCFTDEELDIYEHYWDAISTEKAALSTSHEEGKAEGLAETAIRCAKRGMSVEEIAELTALSVDEIRMILKQNSV